MRQRPGSLLLIHFNFSSSVCADPVGSGRYLSLPDLLAGVYIVRYLTTFHTGLAIFHYISVLAASGCTEQSTERGHAWHPGGRLPVLPAGTFHGSDLHLQGVPLLTPSGSGHHCEEGRSHRYASGQSQGEYSSMFHYCHWVSSPQIPPCLICKGEVLFSSWMSIFSGNGGTFNPSVPVYSFDGRNVMTDPAW